MYNRNYLFLEDNLKIKTNKGKETVWNCHRVCSLGKRNLVLAQNRYGNSVSSVLGSCSLGALYYLRTTTPLKQLWSFRKYLWIR